MTALLGQAKGVNEIAKKNSQNKKNLKIKKPEY